MKIVVKLPYPHRFVGIDIMIKRKIGFLFTNQGTYNFYEDNILHTNLDLKEWIEKNGLTRFVSEMMYGAAQAYCMDKKIEKNFTKSKLIIAISLASKEVQESIMSAWQKSQTFGMVEGKKKTKKVAR